MIDRGKNPVPQNFAIKGEYSSNPSYTLDR